MRISNTMNSCTSTIANIDSGASCMSASKCCAGTVAGVSTLIEEV